MIRRAAIAVFSLAAACASPAGPGSNVSLAGTWSGRYEQLSCTMPPPDPRPCAHHTTGVVTLVLTQQAGSVTGHVEFRSDQTGSVIVGTLFPAGPLPVDGTFESRRLSLTGSTTAPTPAGIVQARLDEWSTEMDSLSVFSGTTAWNSGSIENGISTFSASRVYRVSDLRKTGR